MNARTEKRGNEPSLNTNSPGQPPRQIICVDLDENLVSVLHKDKTRSGLSESAEQCIYFDKQLNLKFSSLCHSFTTEEDDDDDAEIVVRAINFQEWKSFFEKIVAVNKRYQQLVPEDCYQLINPFILTSASYTFKNFMDNVFKEFFGEELAREICGSGNRFLNIHSQCLFQSEDEKGSCMDALYARVWTRKPTKDLPNMSFIPDVAKENIWLIDDNSRHCQSACKLGFSAIHNSTSTLGRASTMFYKNEKPNIILQMQAIVDKAERHCDALAASLGKSQEKKSL